MKIKALLGVAGVHERENSRALRVGKIFEYLVAFALLLVFVQLILALSDYPIDSPWLNAVLWSVFFCELVVNLSLVDKKRRYLAENWLNLLIVMLAVPWVNWQGDWAMIFRSLRLVLLLRFITSFFQDAMLLLGRNRFGQILIGFVFLIIGAGSIFSYIEDRPFIDGIWYAIVTITTVGYGDVVPYTEEGRIFGTVLIVFGVLFFSLVTANFSAFLIGSDQRKLEKDILNYVRQTEKRLIKQSMDIEKHVESIMLHSTQEVDRLQKELQRYQLLEEHLQRLQKEKDSEEALFMHKQSKELSAGDKNSESDKKQEDAVSSAKQDDL
ncbi:potassium channel family protein [Thiomicrorhabdus sp. 6S3-12]|uniref:potassium channel family protein n=1 Tax=Thiomicrorhabdus sp. 6S3-12 TaxID=2819681 RepID=UPI001AACDA98|nr:potassium channel family protein [Thiomicrorhabdus sp. 6S3-12]MBO1924270.1 ion transporter [Thiomicrorhabdus sp. 6S3-12]